MVHLTLSPGRTQSLAVDRAWWADVLALACVYGWVPLGTVHTTDYAGTVDDDDVDAVMAARAGEEWRMSARPDLEERLVKCERRPWGYYLYFNMVTAEDAAALADALELAARKAGAADALAATAAGLSELYRFELPDTVKTVFGMACGYESPTDICDHREAAFWSRLAALLPPQPPLKRLLSVCREGTFVIV